MHFMYYGRTAYSMIAPKAIQLIQELGCRSDVQQKEPQFVYALLVVLMVSLQNKTWLF